MRRTINAEEKKILDKYSDRPLTLMIRGRQGFSFLALAITMTVGCIIGAVISVKVIGMDDPLSLAAMIGLPLILCVIVEVLVDTIGTRIRRDKMFKVGVTQINGATAVGRNEYIEDDLLDEQGRPYRILMTETWMPMKAGERLIAVSNDGITFLLRAEKELAELIPSAPPQQPDEDSIHIGHRNQLTFNDWEVPEKDEKIENFFHYYKNNEKHSLGLVMLGAGFFGLMAWVFVVFAAYGFIFQYTPLGDNYFMVGLPLIPVLTVVTMLAVKKYYGKTLAKYKDIYSVSRVILVCTMVNFVLPYTRDFVVCEKVADGAVETRSYPSIDGYDVVDASKMKPGQVIFKYEYGNGGVFFGSK